MSTSRAAVTTRKRKRERDLDGDMSEETQPKRWYKAINPLTALYQLFSPRVRSTTAQSSGTHSTAAPPARQARQQTPGIPGAFPDATTHSTATSTSVPTRHQQRPATHTRPTHRSRNAAPYWREIGTEVSGNTLVASHLNPEFHNLSKPASLPRRMPLRKKPVQHMSRRARLADTQNDLRHRPGDLDRLRLSQRESRYQKEEEAAELSAQTIAQFRQFIMDHGDLDGLGNLPEEFRRSQKLEAKAQKLKKRGYSPGLAASLLSTAKDYELQKARPRTPEKPRPLVMPLSAETLNSLPNLSKMSAQQQLGMFGRTPVTARDLLTLRTSAWLNDEIINSWLWELCDKAKSALAKNRESKGVPIKDDTPRYHAFNTQWYPTMEAPDWRNKVPRWAKRAKVDGTNLLKVHKILIPIHQGAHWTLIVILPQRRIVRYYNSMPGSSRPYLHAARDWIAHELGDKWKEDEWQIEQAESGQQVNMSDCGVFASLNALASFYTDDISKILPTGELTDGRNLMKFILVNGGFKDDYDLAKLHPDFRLEEDRQVNGQVKNPQKGKEKGKEKAR